MNAAAYMSVSHNVYVCVCVSGRENYQHCNKQPKDVSNKLIYTPSASVTIHCSRIHRSHDQHSALCGILVARPFCCDHKLLTCIS